LKLNFYQHYANLIYVKTDNDAPGGILVNCGIWNKCRTRCGL